ncbi:MAG: tetratricopeptide repeat protein, partial [Verrucomicrobia bacterium]|nr:tetratricopeptide repeat protein [Verrucomicrobiota bacterium]
MAAQTPPAATTVSALDTLFKKGADSYNSGNYDSAIEAFNTILQQAKAGPALEPIYFTIAAAKLRKGDNDGAIAAFRQYLQLYPNGSQINDARAGLTKALIGAKRMPEALAALNSLQGLRGGAQGVDNYAALLGLTLEISDSLMEEKKPAEALAILQNALRRDQVLESQRRRIAELERLFAQAVAASGTSAVGSNVAANRDALATRLADAKDALKRIEENPAFDLPRLLRQARCHMELDQPWEATVAYQEILTRFPTAPDRAYALHGLIFARQAANRLSDAQVLAQRFLSEFPSHPLAGEVAGIGGQLALQRQDAAGAATFFGSAIENGQGAVKERAIFQLGNTRFIQRDWSGARESFDRYVREYPTGEWADNSSYRSAISWFLDDNDPDRYGKAEKAIKAFIKKSPSSTYLPDAYYRLAVCQFAYQEYAKAIAACDEWEKKFPNDGLLAEVLSLQADVLKNLNRNDDATEVYLRAASAASTDEVLDYTLKEAGKLLEQKKDWARLSSVFSTQLDRQPDSKLALGWMYWIAKAKSRAGQPAEAWDFLAERVGTGMANANNEDVEKILVLMAQIRAKQKPVAGAAPAAVAPTEELAGRLHLGAEAP